MASLSIDINDITFRIGDIIKIIRGVQSECFIALYDFDDFEKEMNLLNIHLSDD